MNEASLGILNFWQNLGFSPFGALEVNFIINLAWVIVHSFFRSTGDYRLRQSAEKTTRVPLTFLSYQVILFLFSFVATLAIFLSFIFWFALSERGGSLLWWLPSVTSILLAESSHLLSLAFKKQKKPDEEKETVGEQLYEASSQQLPLYFALLFLGLGIFWLVMIFKNQEGWGILIR